MSTMMGLDEDGVGVGVNTTLSSDTLQSIGLGECDTRVKGWFRKKPMNPCACESVEDDHGVGGGVNTTLLSDTFALVSRSVDL